MNICLECGKTFEDNEILYWQESRGEFWGTPCEEEMSGCPYCEGAYEDAAQCEKCGKYVYLSDLDENSYCEECKENEEEW